MREKVGVLSLEKWSRHVSCSWKETVKWLKEVVADSYTNLRFSAGQMQSRI